MLQNSVIVQTVALIKEKRGAEMATTDCCGYQQRCLLSKSPFHSFPASALNPLWEVCSLMTQVLRILNLPSWVFSENVPQAMESNVIWMRASRLCYWRFNMHANMSINRAMCTLRGRKPWSWVIKSVTESLTPRQKRGKQILLRLIKHLALGVRLCYFMHIANWPFSRGEFACINHDISL